MVRKIFSRFSVLAAAAGWLALFVLAIYLHAAEGPKSEKPQITVDAAETADSTAPLAVTPPAKKSEAAASATKDTLPPVVRAMHVIHCRHRASNGRRLQILDLRLCGLAQRWAEQMARSHSMRHSGYGLRENVAAGQSSADSAMSAWIHSGGHNANLLGGDQAVGFGAATASNGTIYWCSVHGAASAPAKDKEVAATADQPAKPTVIKVSAPAATPAPAEKPTEKPAPPAEKPAEKPVDASPAPSTIPPAATSPATPASQPESQSFDSQSRRRFHFIRARR